MDRCRWVECGKPARGYWCPDHAAQLADAHPITTEPPEDQ